jgi:MFS family permease
LYGLDNTIVADIQAPIIETFGNVERLAWLGIGFPLGSIAVILAVGKAYGIFDVKWVYVLSLLNFVGGSALCGGAPSMSAEIIGRVWAGLGGAGMYLGVLNVMSLNTGPKERSIYIAGCALVWGVGCVLGPVIGGSLADSGAGWRWAFYINLLIFAAASPVIVFILEPYNPDPNSTLGEKLKRMDWVGIVLNAGMYTTFVMAFTFGGAQWSWKDGRTIAMIVVFGVLLILFAIQQTFAIFTTPEARIFPVDFLKSKALVLQYIAMSATATALFIPIYYIPIYFAFTRNDSALSSAVRLLRKCPSFT